MKDLWQNDPLPRIPAYEFVQFLSIAEGSLYETVTLIEVFRRRRLFCEDNCRELRNRCEAIDRKINGLSNSLRGTSNLQPQTSNMIILGINAYHGDVSAVAILDGVLVAAVEEERFRRVREGKKG